MENIIEKKWVRYFNKYESHINRRSRTAGFEPEQLEYLESEFGDLITIDNCIQLIPMIDMDLGLTFDVFGNRRNEKITVSELIAENLEWIVEDQYY